MDPERIEREEPAWAAQLERRHGPVQGEAAHSLARPARLRRPRCLCARRPCGLDLPSHA
jgi:hypothetical protein